LLRAFVVIGRIYEPISNRLHASGANSGKIKTFKEYPSFTFSFEKNSLTQGY